jgi:hypothetical protein
LSNFAKHLSFITNTAMKKNILFIIGFLRKTALNDNIADKIIDKRVQFQLSGLS